VRPSSTMPEDELSKLNKALSLSCASSAFPNTLDTTVMWHDADRGKPLEEAFPRTFLVTGDITASWLRDSTSQLNPYLHLLQKIPDEQDELGAREWDKLYRLSLGLLYMQSQAVLTHPYANSFGPPKSASAANSYDSSSDWVYPPAPGQSSQWGPQPSANFSHHIPNDGVTIWECKWEVDSLANFFRLAVRIAQTSKRVDFVHNASWKQAAQMALSALRSQQRATEVERLALEEALKEQMAKQVYTASHQSDTKQWQDIDEGMATSADNMRWNVHDDHFAIQARKPVEPNLRKRQREGTTKKVLSEEKQKHRYGKGKAAFDEMVAQDEDDARIQASSSSSSSNTVPSEWDRRFKPLAGGIYRFQRAFRSASETRSENGFGEPAKYTGMVKSAFRPSDDATILPFFVPGNAQLASALSDLVVILDTVHQMDPTLKSIRDDCHALAAEVTEAIQKYAVVNRDDMGGSVYAYETDGYGSTYFMDDANIPSLLS
jgi:meiotically up-regulated gene 157 (Mug157) protein